MSRPDGNYVVMLLHAFRQQCSNKLKNTRLRAQHVFTCACSNPHCVLFVRVINIVFIHFLCFLAMIFPLTIPKYKKKKSLRRSRDRDSFRRHGSHGSSKYSHNDNERHRDTRIPSSRRIVFQGDLLRDVRNPEEISCLSSIVFENFSMSKTTIISLHQRLGRRRQSPRLRSRMTRFSRSSRNVLKNTQSLYATAASYQVCPLVDPLFLRFWQREDITNVFLLRFFLISLSPSHSSCYRRRRRRAFEAA